MANGLIDVLVSTSVIEVGVHVENATVMMIEGAERFGLAQLHQFRGRVGRSMHQSYCYVFLTHYSKNAMDRLRVFEKYDDGMTLARYDLEMRGPGDMYGTVQSGFPDLKIASLKDTTIIEMARDEAKRVFEDDANHTRYPELWKMFSDMIEATHLE